MPVLRRVEDSVVYYMDWAGACWVVLRMRVPSAYRSQALLAKLRSYLANRCPASRVAKRWGVASLGEAVDGDSSGGHRARECPHSA